MVVEAGLKREGHIVQGTDGKETVKRKWSREVILWAADDCRGEEGEMDVERGKWMEGRR